MRASFTYKRDADKHSEMGALLSKRSRKADEASSSSAEENPDRQGAGREEPKKTTVADFGYHFKDGRLRSIEGDQPFQWVDQKHYDALGDVIEGQVFDMLEEAGLERRWVSKEGRNSFRRFYFASPGYKDKMHILVLIHGSGVVKAGQWARSLIINDSLERGTQLEYIRRGLEQGWGVVVLNYNMPCEAGSTHHCDPCAHADAEWSDAFPVEVEAALLVVAHSFGGYIISRQVDRCEANLDRLAVVCLTDAGFSSQQFDFVANWNTMPKKMHFRTNSYQIFSGDVTHVGSSASAINSIFHCLNHANMDMTDDEFGDILADCEQIIRDEWKAKQAAKRAEADAAKAEKESVKSLQLEEVHFSGRVKMEKAKEAVKTGEGAGAGTRAGTVEQAVKDDGVDKSEAHKDEPKKAADTVPQVETAQDQEEARNDENAAPTGELVKPEDATVSVHEPEADTVPAEERIKPDDGTVSSQEPAKTEPHTVSSQEPVPTQEVVQAAGGTVSGQESVKLEDDTVSSEEPTVTSEESTKIDKESTKLEAGTSSSTEEHTKPEVDKATHEESCKPEEELTADKECTQSVAQ